MGLANSLINRSDRWAVGVFLGSARDLATETLWPEEGFCVPTSRPVAHIRAVPGRSAMATLCLSFLTYKIRLFYLH